MFFEVRIEKLARAELDEALAWYGLRKDGVDQLLFDAISDAIVSNSKRPLSSPIFLASYRKVRSDIQLSTLYKLIELGLGRKVSLTIL